MSDAYCKPMIFVPNAKDVLPWLTMRLAKFGVSIDCNSSIDGALYLKLHTYKTKKLVYISETKGNPLKIHGDQMVGSIKSMLRKSKTPISKSM